MTNPTSAAEPASAPAAYFITFTCYGARIHGDEKGSVDRFNNAYGARFVEANPHRLNFESRRMKSAPELLDAPSRTIVLEAIKQHANFRGWNLLTAHVRSNHVHIVVEAALPPEKVMTEFKAYATRALNQYERISKRRWTDHGSTRYLWYAEQVDDAVNYVANQQGQPMALYINPSRWQSSQQPHPQLSPERKSPRPLPCDFTPGARVFKSGRVARFAGLTKFGKLFPRLKPGAIVCLAPLGARRMGPSWEFSEKSQAVQSGPGRRLG